MNKPQPFSSEKTLLFERATERSERFLEAYKTLDNNLRDRFAQAILRQKRWPNSSRHRITHHELLTEAAREQDLLRDGDWERLDSFSKLRNAITHPMKTGLEEPRSAIAEPHEQIVREYERMVRNIISPPPVTDWAVKWSDVYKVTLTDLVVDVVKMMVTKTYTHVPVMEGKRLLGVFSENSIFSFLAQHRNIHIDESTSLKSLHAFLDFRSHQSEVFEFISASSRIHTVARLFAEELEKGRRLAVVFITPSGASSEVPVGMVTAYDIAGRY